MKCTLLLVICYLAGRTHSWTYHTGTEPKNWTQARTWCRKMYTDMVVIQNETENEYLVSILPNRRGTPYYWIGITKSQKSDPWTWVGDNSTLKGNGSWAANEPNNNHSNEFCVELYVNENTETRGKWNDEKCSNLKYPVCYQAQCNQTRCNRGSCSETINDVTCLCEPGFKGDTCQTEVECLPPSQPLDGHQNCSHQSNHTLNSTCCVGCSAGHLLLWSAEVSCSSDGNWHGPTPICANYEHALMALAGCGALGMQCCIFFWAMKRRKRKKLAQLRGPEEEEIGSTEPMAEGGTAHFSACVHP